jgi:hypothetical protein
MRLTFEAADRVGDGESESVWISRQVDAMAASWARGEPVRAEAILAGNPGIGDEAAIRLIYEELCLRRESGEDVPTAEFVARFPRWKAELAVLIGCDRLLRPMTRIATLPEVGEDLGPFRLLAELGRGASGKTYLAAEPGLADRLVVLKVISDDQEEHLSLARLQHTNIIPLFSEHSFPERGLRALCMPYLGGASLARILEALAPIPPPTAADGTSSTCWIACRPRAPSPRRSIVRIDARSRRSRMSRQFAGSARGWPTPCRRPTPTAWSTWTSSPRTC